MKKYIFVLLIAATTFLTGCFELDQYPFDKVSTGTFWQTEEHAKQGMMGVYHAMKDNDVFGMYFALDGMSDIGFGHYESQAKGTYTDRTDTKKWQNTYEGVARANVVLQNIDNVNTEPEVKEQYKAEARFMRALYYFHLMDIFGGVPIYDETTIVAKEFGEMNKPRSTIEEVRTFILKDLEFAASLLPVKWNNANLGRATRGAALALSGKVKLYAKDYAGAIKDFEEIVLDPSGKQYNYALYPEYADLFKPEGHNSSEMIFSIQNKSGIGTEYGMPFALRLGCRAAYAGGGNGGWNTCIPTINLVDMYEVKDGTIFNWNDHIPGFNESKEVQKETFMATLAGGVVSKYPDRKEQLIEIYQNRDPRLNESVITPYSYYLGFVANAPRMCEFVIAPGTSENYGYMRDNRGWYNYFWRKFVPEGDMDGELTNRSHVPINFPLIRYADVLLMLAECYNETGKLDEAVALINQVRQRPSTNMPQINSGPAHLEARTKEAVFERIMRERAVELSCEGHRFGDLRRWNLGVKKLNFTYSDLTGAERYKRIFAERDNLWPIPAVEIERNPALKPNNPGW